MREGVEVEDLQRVRGRLRGSILRGYLMLIGLGLGSSCFMEETSFIHFRIDKHRFGLIYAVLIRLNTLK